MAKEYVGDGVYVDDDGYQLEVTTENGIAVTNRIYFEPPVLMALVASAERRGLIRRVTLPRSAEDTRDHVVTARDDR